MTQWIKLSEAQFFPIKFRYYKMFHFLRSIKMLISIPDEGNNYINKYCVDSCEDAEHSPDSNYKYEYINDKDVKNCVKDCPAGTYRRDKNEVILTSSCLTQDQFDFYVRDNPPSCFASCENHILRENIIIMDVKSVSKNAYKKIIYTRIIIKYAIKKKTVNSSMKQMIIIDYV